MKNYLYYYKQTLVNFINKTYLSNIIIDLIIILRLYYFLLPHDSDFYAIINFKQYILGKDILDVGGHKGLASLSIRYLGFKKNFIHIFEPNIKSLRFIQRIKDKKMKLYNFALSDKNKLGGTLVIPKKYFLHSSEATLESNKLIHWKNTKNVVFLKENIKLKKYDSIKNKKKIGFIKIDVEGHEHRVLLGMIKTIKKNLPIIMVEFDKNNFKTISKYFKKDYFIKKYNYKLNTFSNFKYTDKKKNYFLIPKKINFT